MRLLILPRPVRRALQRRALRWRLRAGARVYLRWQYHHAAVCRLQRTPGAGWWHEARDLYQKQTGVYVEHARAMRGYVPSVQARDWFTPIMTSIFLACVLLLAAAVGAGLDARVS